jgi:hypothetical protein
MVPAMETTIHSERVQLSLAIGLLFACATNVALVCAFL